ncbi:MAG: hypothetical protein QOJ70_2631 [Acidobacteriota bacterium]|jgi:hypothetical protein|nr:hypothetical protein [Acidobacteriota bacterium]
MSRLLREEVLVAYDNSLDRRTRLVSRAAVEALLKYTRGRT